MSWFATGAIAVVVVGSILDNKAAAERADKVREAEVLSAKYQYSSQEHQANVAKAQAREAGINNIAEVLRAGAEQDRAVQLAVKTEAGKSLASSEGLTSGRTKGRDLATMYVKGNKVASKASSEVKSMIGQISDNVDKVSNEANVKLINAYQQYVSVLTQPGATFQSSIGGTIGAIGQGAALGASIGSSFGSLGGASTGGSLNTAPAYGGSYS